MKTHTTSPRGTDQKKLIYTCILFCLPIVVAILTSI